MTVQELIEDLEGFDPETEVRIAAQPGWPLQFDVNNVTALENEAEDHRDEDVVFLTTGDHPTDASPYAPEGVFR